MCLLSSMCRFLLPSSTVSPVAWVPLSVNESSASRHDVFSRLTQACSGRVHDVSPTTSQPPCTGLQWQSPRRLFGAAPLAADQLFRIRSYADSVNDSSTGRQSLSCLFSRFRLCTLEQFSSELQVWECAETKVCATTHLMNIEAIEQVK